ncbi:hypothetical protein [Staphylococcus warneri]|nr:hypothetical protein [Staphylococcus warneri]
MGEVMVSISRGKMEGVEAGRDKLDEVLRGRELEMGKEGMK